MNAPVKVETKGYIGKRMARTEDTRLLTGRGVYTDDVHLPGLLHVAFHRSPIARGRIKAIDLSAARDLEGLSAVLTADALPRLPVDLRSFFERKKPMWGKGVAILENPR